jgi:hypothetical protein
MAQALLQDQVNISLYAVRGVALTTTAAKRRIKHGTTSLCAKDR